MPEPSDWQAEHLPYNHFHRRTKRRAVRTAEGLELCSGILRGTPSKITIEVEGVELEVDFLRGQKTGLYLDQKHNYGIVSGYARERRVLDCFTNQGAFALTCARAGATEVTGIEENSENIAAAKRNAARNELKIEWVQQDVFQFLRGAEKAGAQYDLIVLDPPSFTRTKSGLRDALRGYRELHCARLSSYRKMVYWRRSPARIMWMTQRFCKHHRRACGRASSARRLRQFEQAPDHPVLPTIPETEYFRGFLLEMMPGR